MSGRKSKVIQFPNATRKKIVCQYLSDTTTEPYRSPKVSKYKSYCPTAIGLIIGLAYVSLLLLG